MLRVVCGLLLLKKHVACWLVFVVCVMLWVACCLLLLVCCLLFVCFVAGCRLFFVGFNLLLVCVLFAEC